MEKRPILPVLKPTHQKRGEGSHGSSGGGGGGGGRARARGIGGGGARGPGPGRALSARCGKGQHAPVYTARGSAEFF